MRNLPKSLILSLSIAALAVVNTASAQQATPPALPRSGEFTVTYAFVNPVVAVLVGWALAGEVLDGAILAAAALVVGAVALIVTGPRRA